MLKWTVRWILTYYYSSREGIRCVTFDDDANRNYKGHLSSWAFSVYLVDSGGASPAQLLQSIIDCTKDQPALKLVRKTEAFGWIHLWKLPQPSESPLRMTVQELPPVWKHQLVTEDSVHVRKYLIKESKSYVFFLKLCCCCCCFLHFKRNTCRKFINVRTE